MPGARGTWSTECALRARPDRTRERITVCPPLTPPLSCSPQKLGYIFSLWKERKRIRLAVSQQSCELPAWKNKKKEVVRSQRLLTYWLDYLIGMASGPRCLEDRRFDEEEDSWQKMRGRRDVGKITWHAQIVALNSFVDSSRDGLGFTGIMLPIAVRYGNTRVLVRRARRATTQDKDWLRSVWRCTWHM